jgi:hypothetical protein
MRLKYRVLFGREDYLPERCCHDAVQDAGHLSDTRTASPGNRPLPVVEYSARPINELL